MTLFAAIFLSVMILLFNVAFTHRRKLSGQGLMILAVTLAIPSINFLISKG